MLHIVKYYLGAFFMARKLKEVQENTQLSILVSNHENFKKFIE